MDTLEIICNHLNKKINRKIYFFKTFDDAFNIKWPEYDSTGKVVIGHFSHRIPFIELQTMRDPVAYAEDIIDKYLKWRKGNGSQEEQPLPQQNDYPIVWDLVIQDMRERDEKGVQKYRTHLQPFNGRDALIDAYQEALDLAVYLRQLIYERDMTSSG